MNNFLIKVGLKDQDPKVLVKEWDRKMRAEKRGIEKQIREIEREEKKVQMEIKKLAKQGGQEASMRILAKEIVQSRKAITRLYTAQASINSIGMQMKSMQAQANMGKVMKTSAETMKAMNKLMSMPETMNAMKDMSREMEKAGFLQEMMDDMMDDTIAEEEGDIDDEVNKVILEVTVESLNKAPEMANKGKALFAKGFEEEQEEEEEEDDEETRKLENRLKNLS